MSLSAFKILGDERGKLVALEGDSQVPFAIQRVFYIFDTKQNISRGKHAHYKTKQLLVAVNGYCKVTLNDGKSALTYELNSPDKGLFQDALVWGEMHDFSSDCVLMVLASHHYDQQDYIYSFEEFLKEVEIDS